MAENYFGITDMGRQRGNNEDSFIAEPVMMNRYIAACVIDGVGGYEGGEVAAAIARQSILEHLNQPVEKISANWLQEAIVYANENIYKEKQRNAANGRMACVLTMALVEKGSNKFYYGHVGDTRLYLFRDLSLVKLTKDHSFVGFLEDSGRLNEDAAMAHPKRNEINKALGFESLTNASDYIETGDSPFLPGDLILLCSDGLTDMIDREKIISILSKQSNLEEKGKALIGAANEAGGKDNITVVLVQNDHQPVAHQATKPMQLKNPSNPEATVVKSTIQSKKEAVAKSKSNHLLILFLLLISVFSIGGFLWQWVHVNKIQNETAPVTNALPIIKNTNEQQLSDTLQRMKGHNLLLQPEIFGNAISLTDTLTLQRDSMTINGLGNVLIKGDSAKYGNAIVVIAPSVKYLLLENLTIRHIIFLIPQANGKVLHVKNVRLQSVALKQYSQSLFVDSLYSGTDFGIPMKDTVSKRIKP